jgi:hypothetical protein
MTDHLPSVEPYLRRHRLAAAKPEGDRSKVYDQAPPEVHAIFDWARRCGYSGASWEATSAEAERLKAELLRPGDADRVGADVAWGAGHAAREEAIEEQLWDEEVRREARRRATGTASPWAPPDDDAWEGGDQGTLAELLGADRTPRPMLVDGLLGASHNALLVAPRKVGKTTLGLNLVAALLRGEPFLGRETRLTEVLTAGWCVEPGRPYLKVDPRVEGYATWWNGEMDADDLLAYARPLLPVGNLAAFDDLPTPAAREEYYRLNFLPPQRLVVRNLRGRRVNLLDDRAAEWAAKDLLDCGLWVIDSWRVLCAWCGVKENDNSDVGRLTAGSTRSRSGPGFAPFWSWCTRRGPGRNPGRGAPGGRRRSTTGPTPSGR